MRPGVFYQEFLTNLSVLFDSVLFYRHFFLIDKGRSLFLGRFWGKEQASSELVSQVWWLIDLSDLRGRQTRESCRATDDLRLCVEAAGAAIHGLSNSTLSELERSATLRDRHYLFLHFAFNEKRESHASYARCAILCPSRPTKLSANPQGYQAISNGHACANWRAANFPFKKGQMARIFALKRKSKCRWTSTTIARITVICVLGPVNRERGL